MKNVTIPPVGVDDEKSFLLIIFSTMDISHSEGRMIMKNHFLRRLKKMTKVSLEMIKIK